MHGRMIITCPHCQTKYQVTYEVIGAVGRKVQCAHCQRAWQQGPVAVPPPKPEPVKIDLATEDGLDKAIEAEERKTRKAGQPDPEPNETAPVPASAPDAAVIRKRQRAFTRRQSAMNKQMPLAKFRRALRVLGAVALLASAVSAFWGRVWIVEQYPAMAGVYSAIGMPVNVVGLEFASVETLRALRQGREVLSVKVDIVGAAAGPVSVPPVVVTLLDARGSGIYEWSVTASTPTLKPGEHALVETQLTLPPATAERVRLRFANGTQNTGAPPQAASGHGETDHNAAASDEHGEAESVEHSEIVGAEHGNPAPAGHTAAGVAGHGEGEPAGHVGPTAEQAHKEEQH